MTASLRAPPPESSRRRFGVGGARKRLRGLTRVEVLMVVALIALLGGSILFGGGLMSGARERGACTLLVSAVRKGLAHANASGHPVRLVMNLDEGRIHLEEASSSKVVRDNPNTV